MDPLICHYIRASVEDLSLGLDQLQDAMVSERLV